MKSAKLISSALAMLFFLGTFAKHTSVSEQAKQKTIKGLANDDEGYKAEFIRLIEGSKTIAKL